MRLPNYYFDCKLFWDILKGHERLFLKFVIVLAHTFDHKVGQYFIGFVHKQGFGPIVNQTITFNDVPLTGL